MLIGLVLLAASACIDGADRPTEAAWIPEWEDRQVLIPGADAILNGGQEFCDELNGLLRVSLPELRPTPTEALDDPVEEWISHAVSIVFECSDDEATVVQQLNTLDVIAAEIDGGLGFETG